MINKNYRHFSRLLLLLLLMAAIGSCRPQREVTPVSELLQKSARSLVSSMHSNHADFNYFSSRFSGSATIDKQTYNLSGNMRIHKDEAIFISVAPVLGIEVARILITPDTVKIVNRLEGTYFVGDMSFINNMLNTDLDFYMLQAILIGNDFEHFNHNNFRVMEDRGRLMLHSPSRGRQSRGNPSLPYENNLWLDTGSFRIQQNVLYDPREQRTIKADYRSYASVGGQLLPSEIFLEFSETASRAELLIRFNRTALNNPQQLTFSIPSRYVPMDL